MKKGVLDTIQQDIYESCAVDANHTNEALNKRLSELERDNRAFRDDIDAQEQYSRRNCLLLHGVTEGNNSNNINNNNNNVLLSSGDAFYCQC